MGVIRRSIEPKAIRLEDSSDELPYADYDLTESDAESVQNVRVVAASKTQKRKETRESRRLRRFHDSIETGGVTMRRHMGQRKWRRVENARFLLSMIDREDIVDDFSDMIERNVTAFDELFNDSAKMAVWNDFIAKDEVEQAKLLEEARCITRKEAGAIQPGSWFRVGGRREAIIEEEKGKKNKEVEKVEEKGQGDEDKRRHHPAYSASSCFARLSPKLRNFFNDKSLPWPLIDRVDRELREFFISLPDGRWRRPIDNSRHRLAIHAVSAFLMLSSKTCRHEDKDVIEIENRRPYFIPPHSLLLAYLATKRKAPIEFIPEPRWPDDVIIEEEEEEEEEDTDDDKTVVDSSESPLDSSFEII